MLDSITSSTHFVSPAVYAVALAGRAPDARTVLLLVAFFCWGMASHAFGAVQDIPADRAAGIGSVATVLRRPRDRVLASSLYARSRACSPLLSGWPTALAAAARAALPRDGAAVPRHHDAHAEEANRGWRRFLAINYGAGFVVTLLAIGGAGPAPDAHRRTRSARTMGAMRSVQRIEPGPGQESVWDYPRPPRGRGVHRARPHPARRGDRRRHDRRRPRARDEPSARVLPAAREAFRRARRTRPAASACASSRAMARYLTIAAGDRIAVRAAWTYPRAVRPATRRSPAASRSTRRGWTVRGGRRGRRSRRRATSTAAGSPHGWSAPSRERRAPSAGEPFDAPCRGIRRHQAESLTCDHRAHRPRGRPLLLLPAPRPAQLDALRPLRPHHLPRVPDPGRRRRPLRALRRRGGRPRLLAAGRRPPPKPARMRRTRSRARSLPMAAPSWLAATGAPVSIGVLGASVAIWLAGFFTANLPVIWLAALPGTGWQLWRFLTAPLASPAALDISVILSFALQSVFWFLSAPRRSGCSGAGRSSSCSIASTLVGSAAALLSGQAAYGLFGPLFGVFAAVLVLVWPEAQVRNRFLVMIGVNLLLILVISRGQGLPEVIGAMLAGAGLTALRQRAADRPLPKPWTPQLIVGGARRRARAARGARRRLSSGGRQAARAPRTGISSTSPTASTSTMPRIPNDWSPLTLDEEREQRGREEGRHAARGRVEPEQLALAARPARAGRAAMRLADCAGPTKQQSTGRRSRRRWCRRRAPRTRRRPRRRAPTSDTRMTGFGPKRSSKLPESSVAEPRDDVGGDAEEEHLPEARSRKVGGDHRAEGEDAGEPVAEDGAGDEEAEQVAVGAPQHRDVAEELRDRRRARRAAAPGVAGGASGTASSTGTAKTADQTAQTSAQMRMSRPPSSVDAEQLRALRDERRVEDEQQHDAAEVAGRPADGADPPDRARRGDRVEHRVVVDAARSRRRRCRRRRARRPGTNQPGSAATNDIASIATTTTAVPTATRGAGDPSHPPAARARGRARRRRGPRSRGRARARSRAPTSPRRTRGVRAGRWTRRSGRRSGRR